MEGLLGKISSCLRVTSMLKREEVVSLFLLEIVHIFEIWSCGHLMAIRAPDPGVRQTQGERKYRETRRISLDYITRLLMATGSGAALLWTSCYVRE